MSRPLLALAAAIALALVACDSGSNEPPRPSGGGSTAPAQAPASPAEPGDKPSKDERLVEAIQDHEADYVVIAKGRYVPMWEKLDREDPDYAFDMRSPDGGHSPMLIADATMRDGEAWFDVYLPVRPNGSKAWLRAEDVRVQQRYERIEVDLSKRTLEHFQDGELVDRFKVGVGQSQYPTGTGTFYVWARVPYENPYQPYGIFALGLSGFSPVLSDWPGEGRMAIHGTPYASNRGQAVSHGCVRVYNADMESLVDVPLGTPVIITR